ncbi:MAG: hypothetical protein VW776_06370 [Betaproteobacteria bacterium]
MSDISSVGGASQPRPQQAVERQNEKPEPRESAASSRPSVEVEISRAEETRPAEEIYDKRGRQEEVRK